MRLIPLFISIAVAFVAFYVIYVFNTGNTPVKEKQVIVEKPVEVVRPEPTKQILIASRYIPPGTIVDSTMLERQDWPERLIVDQFLVADTPQANIMGMVVRSPFQPREPLALSKLAKKGDPSFLAAVLPNGQRMVTIATDGINGVAGFIYPGDKVDVLLTHNVEVPVSDPAAARNATKQEQISEPLLVDVPVIAVDQRASTDAAEKQTLPSSVSLQVTPDDAQKLRLAEKRGTLSLALRPLKDKDDNIATPTTRFDITRFYDLSDPNGKEGEEGVKANPLMAKLPSQGGINVMVTRGVKSETIQLEQPSTAATAAPSTPAPRKEAAAAATSQQP